MYSGDAAASYADFLPHRRAEALDQVLNGVHVFGSPVWDEFTLQALAHRNTQD